ncbi:hypothetical protein ACPWSR_08335 [Alloiococcus sp. CFN-8]|uniref:hypothetical protein n=1 Tax=Alloiococcus sp. CFN-8 TaxID=3416081 RepID=UPI003CF441E6
MTDTQRNILVALIFVFILGALFIYEEKPFNRDIITPTISYNGNEYEPYMLIYSYRSATKRSWNKHANQEAVEDLAEAHPIEVHPGDSVEVIFDSDNSSVSVNRHYYFKGKTVSGDRSEAILFITDRNKEDKIQFTAKAEEGTYLYFLTADDGQGNGSYYFALKVVE